MPSGEVMTAEEPTATNSPSAYVTAPRKNPKPDLALAVHGVFLAVHVVPSGEVMACVSPYCMGELVVRASAARATNSPPP